MSYTLSPPSHSIIFTTAPDDMGVGVGVVHDTESFVEGESPVYERLLDIQEATNLFHSVTIFRKSRNIEFCVVGVMLGLGRDKRRLKDDEGSRDPSRASSRDRGAGGFRSSSKQQSVALENQRDLYKERTLESSAKTLRGPRVKGELSRFKLSRNYRKYRRIYTWRSGARTKQCS